MTLHLPACLKSACVATQAAGAVAPAALDLVATAVTLAMGVEVLR